MYRTFLFKPRVYLKESSFAFGILTLIFHQTKFMVESFFVCSAQNYFCESKNQKSSRQLVCTGLKVCPQVHMKHENSTCTMKYRGKTLKGTFVSQHYQKANIPR